MSTTETHAAANLAVIGGIYAAFGRARSSTGGSPHLGCGFPVMSTPGQDVVVTGIRMPPTGTDEGVRLCAELRRWAPETGVVVVTHSADPGHALAVLGGGARRSAYLLKERVRNRAEPTAAIRAVAGGASIVDPRIRERLLVTQRLSDHSPLRELTSREREVLEEVAAGKSNQAIAATLLLTQRAVEKHINSIFRKFGLNGTPQVSKRVKAVLLPRAERASITCNG